jgi:hypothetical protein
MKDEGHGLQETRILAQVEKFQRYTQPFIQAAQAQAIIEAVAALPGAAPLQDLTRLIASAP